MREKKSIFLENVAMADYTKISDSDVLIHLRMTTIMVMMTMKMMMTMMVTIMVTMMVTMVVTIIVTIMVTMVVTMMRKALVRHGDSYLKGTITLGGLACNPCKRQR